MLAITWCRIFCLPVFATKDIKIKAYRTIILPVVLYGCETWLLMLRKGLRLRVFELGRQGEYLCPREIS